MGGGDDTVLVRDTHFQMEVVNGFDGGGNDGDGRDVITFDTAQIFVSNIDNFEVLNVTDRAVLFLTNPSPYIYAVRDEVNIDYHDILSFGQGPHFCLGAHLARTELETAVRVIFERFPRMTLVPGKPVEIVGGVLRGPRELWVRPAG